MTTKSAFPVLALMLPAKILQSGNLTLAKAINRRMSD
jgi:hypothetical protein